VRPHRIIRVCATRADCHVSLQALTTREAKTVDTDKSKAAGIAAGKETAEAWSNVWNGKVQAYNNLE